MGQLVKNPPAMWETWVRFLGWEDPLEKGKATHSVFWPGEFHGLQSMRSQRVRHDLVTFTFTVCSYDSSIREEPNNPWPEA